jgi:tetratricopeptide (TPR) repeat protein
MATKLDYFQRKLSGPTVELRAHLDYLEDASIGLSRKGKAFVADYFARLDRVQEIFQLLEGAATIDLRPEHVQFETALNRLRQEAGPVLYTLGGPQGLKLLRPETAIETAQPWWFIDRYVGERMALQRKRVLQGMGILAAIALVVVILFNTVLKPDPALIALKAHNDAAFAALIQEADYEMALDEIDQALAVKPDDLESLVVKGVILEQLGRPDEAETIFGQAIQLAPGPETVYWIRGQMLLQLDQFEEALRQAEAAIEANPDYPQAWFLSGQAYDRMGDVSQAFNNMEIASNLALEQGDNALYAIIRVNMGYLVPSGGGPSGDGLLDDGPSDDGPSDDGPSDDGPSDDGGQ